MKKIWLLSHMLSVYLSVFAFSFLALLLLAGGVTQALWELGSMGDVEKKPFYQTTSVDGDLGKIETQNIGEMLGKAITADKSLLMNPETENSEGLLTIFGFWWPEYEGVPKALVYAKMIINLLLWLVSLIALVMVVYTFYLMFFSEDSKGIEKVKKNMIGIVIALVVLGVSRFIISFIFDFYQSKLLNAT